MEASTATSSPATPSQLPHRSPTDFQTVDEAIKEWEEQDKINAQLAREAGISAPGQARKKSKAARPVIDLDAFTTEQRAKEELGESENWIGKLLEYRNAHPKQNGLNYRETAEGTRFKCFVTITERAESFGGQSFSNKKDAKRFAAKKAIDWLIETKHMPDDGSVKFPKPVLPVNAPRDPDVPSFAGQVHVQCEQLGIIPPTYKIVKSGEGLGVWSGYAVFEGVNWIDGKVGEFENVFGKKQAKETCAEQILSFLNDVQRQRNAHNAYSPPPPAPQQNQNVTSRQGSVSPSDTNRSSPSSATAQVLTLCHRLGFRQPTYVLEKVPENLSLYSGYAHFDGDPRVPGKVGEFSYVFSKKQAKEKCAEEVVALLKRIERQRLDAAAGMLDEEEERKRKRVSLDAVEKLVKQKMEEGVDGGAGGAGSGETIVAVAA